MRKSFFLIFFFSNNFWVPKQVLKNGFLCLIVEKIFKKIKYKYDYLKTYFKLFNLDIIDELK